MNAAPLSPRDARRAAMHPAERAAEDALEARERAASRALRAVPGVSSGPMGLTPDSVKASPAYRAAKAEHVAAFEALRAFNVAQAKRRKGRGNP